VGRLTPITYKCRRSR